MCEGCTEEGGKSRADLHIGCKAANNIVANGVWLGDQAWVRVKCASALMMVHGPCPTQRISDVTEWPRNKWTHSKICAEPLTETKTKKKNTPQRLWAQLVGKWVQQDKKRTGSNISQAKRKEKVFHQLSNLFHSKVLSDYVHFQHGCFIWAQSASGLSDVNNETDARDRHAALRLYAFHTTECFVWETVWVTLTSAASKHWKIKYSSC